MATTTTTHPALLTPLPSSLLLSIPHHHHCPTLPFRSTKTTSHLPLITYKPCNPISSSSSSSIQIPPNPHTNLRKHEQSQFLYPSGPIHNSFSPINALFDHYHYLLRLSILHNNTQLTKAIHASISKVEEDTHLSNTLISTYIKLGFIDDAQKIFSKLSSPDVVSYTAIISAFAKSNREDEAIEIFFTMRNLGIEPNEFSFVAILTACIRLLDSQLGSQVHSFVIKTGYCSFTYVSNSLMGMYIKCGRVDYGVQLFGEMPQRDVTSWNTVISGLVKELRYERAFEFFRDMQWIDGFRVDQFTISSLLVAATEGFAPMEGREIHAHALKIGFESNLSVNNALIGFYSKCGKVEDVVAVFERMPVKDVITWTGMVTGYMEFGLVESALKILNQMPERNCVSYSAVLAGFCQNGEALRALEFFRGMMVEGVELSDFTLTSIVNACAILSEVGISRQIHGFVTKSGFGSNAWIEAALLDMCTKCDRMANAKKMFAQLSYNQNCSFVWTSMICGYARNGQPDEALSLFCIMQAKGDVIVDEVALTAVLGVCGTLGFHDMGKQIHCYVIKYGFLSDFGVGNTIFSMYSKCGNMEDAIKFYNLMPKYDIVSWNSLISCHLLYRQGDKALAVWSNMEKMGIKPDSLTFVLVLSAFRHTNSNSIDTCRGLFLSMRSVYGIEPTSEHYASMVGVLGYWGCLEEAEEMINNMPFEPDVSVWRALLDSCRLMSNTSLGRVVAKRILAMEPLDPSTYILISNLYSASGRWHCSEQVRQEMREKGLWKHPSRSWIIHQNKVQSFYARDKSHSQTKDIYSGLEILILECLKIGYVPDTSFVLHEVEEHQKKEFLFYHSAKLAVAYGLLMTKMGRPVRVVKNVILCGDCHTFFKYVSIVTRREITLRDASGFHLFRNGECSCRDYW